MADGDSRALNELFGQVAADTVGENRDLRVDLDARLEALAFVAMAAHAAVPRPHADDTVAVHQQLGRGKTREHVDALRVDEPRQPFSKLLNRDDVIPVVAERRRREGKLDLARSCEEVDAILVDLCGQRRPFGFEVGDQLPEGTRIQHGARQQMRTGFRRFFEEGDAQRLSSRLLELGKPECRRQPRRPTADDQDVDVERLAVAHFAYLNAETQRRRVRSLPEETNLCVPAPLCWDMDGYVFSSSAIIAGTISNRSPTMP